VESSQYDNKDRQNRGLKILMDYRFATNNDTDQTAMVDLLADLMHLGMVRDDLNFDDAVHIATGHVTEVLNERADNPPSREIVMNGDKFDAAVDVATHAAFEAWEQGGFEVSRIDLESAKCDFNDLITPWMRDNLHKFTPTIKCDSCAWRGVESDCDRMYPDIPGLSQRVAPGEPTPFAQCPVCDCLCHAIGATEEGSS